MEQGRIEVPQEADSGPCEERAAPRHTVLIRAAKLIAPEGEFICVIRDVSEIGISLRGFHNLPANPPLLLELQTGERHEIESVWDHGLEAGFRFVGVVDIERIVAEDGRFPKRQLRLNIAFPVEMGFLGRRIPAEVSNISQQGARIECDTLLAIAQPLRLFSDLLPEVRARVRWRRDREYGVVFDDIFSLSQLARFAAGTQYQALLEDSPSGAALRR